MANTLNLDRSQRLDVVCKRGDTFKMNLELKDENGVNIDLNGAYDGSAINAPIYAFKMQVRNADTDDGVGAAPGVTDGHLIEAWAEVANRGSTAATYLDPTNLATFTIPHGTMEGLDSGVYVYDIEKRLFNALGSTDWDDNASIESATPDDVETILYGVFTVNEDITL